jgi:hypothetical protein
MALIEITNTIGNDPPYNPHLIHDMLHCTKRVASSMSRSSRSLISPLIGLVVPPILTCG